MEFFFLLTFLYYSDSSDHVRTVQWMMVRVKNASTFHSSTFFFFFTINFPSWGWSHGVMGLITMVAVSILKKYTEDLHFRSGSSVIFETLLCLAVLRTSKQVGASYSVIVLFWLWSSHGGMEPVLTCTGHWSFVPWNSGVFLVSSKGNPMVVWTRGGAHSLDTPLFPEVKQ